MIDSLIKYVTGIVRLRGATDNTAIGNVGDRLKVEASFPTNDPQQVEFGREHKDMFHNYMFVNPVTLWESDHRFSKREEYWDETVSGAGASSTHVPEKLSVRLTVGTASGEKVVRQTYQHFHYIKGNSQRIMLTGNFDGVKTNVRKRYGYFNSYNGLFFETNGTTMNVVVRSDVSGSIVDTAIPSTSWNVDKLDGTGASGKIADPNKQQLFIIDFAFLGAGPIRFSIMIGQELVPVHVIESSNVLATSWSRSADLPIRCEIENIGTSASASNFYKTCSTVKSMGGQRSDGSVKVVDTGVTAVSVTTTDKVVAAIRLSSSAVRGASIVPLGFDITPASGTSIIYYQVILRPTLSTVTWSPYTDIAEVPNTTPTYTSGTGIVIESGYMDLGASGSHNITSGPVSASVGNDKFLGYNIAGVGDSLILLVRTYSGSGSIYFSGKWGERT